MAERGSPPDCSSGNCCSEIFYQVKPEEGKYISSWNDILNFYQSTEQELWRRRWIFRGQEDASWCLETSLERAIRRQLALPLDEEALRWEHKLLRQFQRIAPLYLAQSPDEKNWIEWLALLRHYGGPARLLDWTYSFYVAVFQAMQKADDGKHCAIWALDVDWWKKQVMDRLPELSKIRNEEDPHSRTEFELIRKLKEKKGIWPVNAFRLNERLHAQQGLFLMPLDVSHSFMDNLKHLAKPEEGRSHLWKIVIPTDLRKQCLVELQRMNIHNQSLFRGLSGLASDLENHMLMPEMFKDIEPKT